MRGKRCRPLHGMTVSAAGERCHHGDDDEQHETCSLHDSDIDVRMERRQSFAMG